MVEVRIDGQRCDVEAGFKPDESIASFDAEAFADLEAQRTGRVLRFRIPLTPTNNRILGHAADPTAGERFNTTRHEGEVRVDGVALLQGETTLLGVEGENGQGYYLLRIRDGAGDWVERLQSRSLAETSLGYEAMLDQQTIEQSWTGESVVRFLPVRYDDYREPYDSTSLYPPQRVMTVADYHPFISVVEMLRAIFADAGYTIESQFLLSDEAQRLYFSGCYPSSDRSLTQLESSSGFKAGRDAEGTATADALGRVWMTPLVLTSSIGNFVTTTEGEELYNNRGVLRITEQGVEYRPSVETSVGFEIFLKYSTDCRVVSSKRLQGLDHLYVDTGCDMQIPLTNPYKDRRSTAVAGVEYKCFVFDFDTEQTYCLVYRTSAGDTPIKSITAAETSVVIPSSVSDGECLLLDANGVEHTGDWALYDGYVTSTTRVDVEVTLQTPPERLSPSKAKDFTRMYLHGGEQGQSITLGKECTLRPTFSSSPAAGSTLTTADIMAHDVTQAEFVEAVRQMFNLRIATVEPSKRVCIEPYDDFYRGEVCDLSLYAEPCQAIEAEELALSVRQRRLLCYRAEGDGAVARHNAQAEERFGEWEYTTPSRAALMGRERRANPLFCPTISTDGIHASAPSAKIMQVGDRDADEVAGVSMRVVRYEGLRPLPEGERWGAPSLGGEYPYAAFHAEQEFTLCFENRDGVQGLHRYYDSEWQEQATRRSLTLTLTLPPHLLSQMMECHTEGGARRRYRLNICGQGALYRLQAIEAYDVATLRARCRFVRLASDQI